MGRRACLAIGVSTVNSVSADQGPGFAYLDGAIYAARTLGQWAQRAGFGADNVRVVDDGGSRGKLNPVTRERVQQAVDELFPPQAEAVDQLILSFCGHGLTDANLNSITWLFSDSLQQKYCVKADAFYTELLLHGIKRITLISDACREAPQTLELLRLDGVRGIVVQGTQVDSPRFDRLASCQDGKLGYMVKDPSAAAPGKCIFSGVITDALWGLEPSAIDNGMITTATLGKCVRVRTSERASTYHLKLNPQCQVDPESAVLYQGATPLPDPAGLQPWPAGSQAAVLGAQVMEGFALKHVDLQVADNLLFGLDDDAPADEGVRSRLERISQPVTGNLMVWGKPARLFSASSVERAAGDSFFSAFNVASVGEPVLVALADGQFTPVVPYQGLYAVVAPGSTGEVFQVYGAQGVPEHYQNALQAIDDFAAGRLQADHLTRLAAILKHAKHADPMLGVICAYLYRAIADYDNIRRMAWYFAANDQPVPFDVALLGAMAVTRDASGALCLQIPAVNAGEPTPAIAARIGGRCPWLGLGWDYVKDPRAEWAVLVDGLADHAPHVRRSGATVLPAKVAHQLAKDWRLLPSTP
ncbi:hypothetical protein [Pseudomonas sp. NPDC089401]|uniref:hypothetical protein n=1 Tax=Pseudomonas sp. NPDC089401 TaxID=3364462 RepID=UPI003815CE73